MQFFPFVLTGLVIEDAVIELPQAGAPAVASNDLSIWYLVTQAGPVVQFVLITLVVMSVITWGIVIAKWFQFKKIKAESHAFSDVFWSSRNLAQISEASKAFEHSPVAAVFDAGYSELSQIVKASKKQQSDDYNEFGDIENIERALQRAKVEEVTSLEKGTTFLATTASAAPFIGLFGTVWGIMGAFLGLSQAGSTSIQAVAPGIAEALVATAIGLAAAIPAAIFFNYYVQQIRILSRSMDMFSSEFLNIARRHFLR